METKVTSSNGWQTQLKSMLSGTNERLAIVGVGNELRGDDAVGMTIVQDLKANLPQMDSLLWVGAGSAPENVTGQIRRFKPHQVLLIDAVDMGKSPGTIQWIDIERDIIEPASTTHSLSLSLLTKYLQMDLQCEVYLLGIQVEQTELGAPLSVPIQSSADEVKRFLYTHVLCHHISG